MIVWLDFETLGLAPDSAVIEIAAQVTNERGEYVGMPFHTVLRTTLDQWDDVDQAVLAMHQASGLYEESLASDRAESGGWHLLVQHLDAVLGPPPEKQSDCPVLGGSGVHFERAIMAERHTFGAPGRLHYRNLDVSTLRSVVIASDAYDRWPKQPSHRALHDVMDAIAEYKHYLVTLSLMPPEKRS